MAFSIEVEEWVGSVWHRFITRRSDPDFTHAQVQLSDQQRALALLFHAIGVFPPDGTPSYETGPFVLAFGYRAVFGILAGYIDEVRFKRGEAVWTSNFTVPTSAYTADDRTVLLCHFDGANGDKVTFDSSGSSYGANAFGDTTTPALTFQNGASLASTQTRGGHSTSLSLNGANQYVVQTFASPTSGHPLYFGTNTKFCIEGWFYVPTLSGISTYAALLDLRGTGYGIALNVYLLASGQMQANVR